MSRRHVVAAGECLSSIAFDNGFAPETVWSDLENEKLRQQRQSFNLLVPGDVVMIPTLRPRDEQCATGRRHRFKRKGVPEKFRVRIMDEDQPRAAAPYRLSIDGKELRGKTDADGWIDHFMPPDARRAELVLLDEQTGEAREGDEVMEFALGHAVPIDADAGVHDRLFSLGYLAPGPPDEAALAGALREFQTDHELDRTGELDDKTRKKIEEVYGQ